MLKRLRKWLEGNESMALTPEQTDLLRTLRRDIVGDPVALSNELAGHTRQIETGDVEFDRLDKRGDSSAYLKLHPLAERLEVLRARAKTLPAQIAEAQRREDAFLQLAEHFDVVAEDVQAQFDMLLEHPPADEHARLAALGKLEDTTRLHSRIAWALQAVSVSRRFKEPADALRLLRDALEARLRELERVRVPGAKTRTVPPPEIAALMAALGGHARKETA